MCRSAFNDLWRSKPEKFDINWFYAFRNDATLHKLCGNWFAQYDIHRIGGNGETLFTRHIPLSPEEIALQMQFSFRLSPTRSWKFKFPMAISPDLTTILVLRTVVTAVLHELPIQVFVHTPDFSDHEGLRVSWARKIFAPDLPFFYEWAFSSDSCYAILRARKLTENHGSLAVFGLSRSFLGMESHMIEYREVNGGHSLPLCVFHPDEPKVLMLDYDKLIFKDLRTGGLPNTVARSSLIIVTGLEYANKPINCFNIVKLEFSQCGNYYVLNYEDESRPHIYPLPWDSASVGSLEAKPATASHITKKRKPDPAAQGSFEMFSSTSHGDLESVGTSSIVIDANAETMLCISTGTSQRIRLTRHQKEVGKNSSCVLVTMPQETNVRNINTKLVPLEHHNTKRVRILLTPKAQGTYESDTATISQHLPAVIDRDTATLTLDLPQKEVKALAVADLASSL